MFKIRQYIKALIYNYSFCRLAQIRESGIQNKLLKESAPLKEPNEQPSIIDVSMVTVAPIFVVLAAGYVTAIFVLLIERCVHGHILKCWPRGIVRRWRQLNIEGWCTKTTVWTKLTSQRTNIIFTYCYMTLFNITFSFASKSVICLHPSSLSRNVVPFFSQPHTPHNLRKYFQNHNWKIELHEMGKEYG
jgi:hypothetical protein